MSHVPLPVQYKVWLKPSAEQSYLYGNHVLKSGLGRITENTPQYQGVIMYSMGDIPLVSSGCHGRWEPFHHKWLTVADQSPLWFQHA